MDIKLENKNLANNIVTNICDKCVERENRIRQLNDALIHSNDQLTRAKLKYEAEVEELKRQLANIKDKLWMIRNGQAATNDDYNDLVQEEIMHHTEQPNQSSIDDIKSEIEGHSIDVGFIKNEPTDTENELAESHTVKSEKTHHNSYFKENNVTSNRRVNINQIDVKTRSYECLFCKRQFQAPQGLKRHVIMHHVKTPSKDPIKCSAPDCERTFPATYIMKKHAKWHTNERAFKCPDCDKCFKNTEAQRRHQKVHTERKTYACNEPNCNRVFYTNSLLQDHLKQHTGEMTYMCRFVDCQQLFSTRYKLERHRQFIHDVKYTARKQQKRNFGGKVKCLETGCRKEFASKITLNQHIRFVHMGIKDYECRELGCKKAFQCLNDLKRHTEGHSSTQNSLCPICGKSFKYKSAVKPHMKTHERHRPTFVCDISGCGKTFQSYGGLYSHTKTHSDERPFTCDHPGCSSSFKLSAALQLHQRIHTGERPYVCQFGNCEQTFVTSSGLYSHRKIHTGERPHQCHYPMCDKAFIQRYKLKMHLMTHEK